jgi:hypothetical protein
LDMTSFLRNNNSSSSIGNNQNRGERHSNFYV